MVASSEYHVNIVISQKTKGDASVKKSATRWTELKSALGLAQGAFNKVLQVAKKAYAFIGEGAAIERAEIAINSLAKSYGTSGDEIVRAIQEASDFTIDKMTAMQVANKAMLMGVAQSPEQFEELARTATVLGRAMGLDATTAIDRFTIAAGRKSTKVADDLGLLVDATAANEKYAASINKTVEQLNAEEQSTAFLNAMMDAAEPKVAALGSTTLTTADKMERAEAAVTDTKGSLSKLASALWDSSGQADLWNETLTASRDITEGLTGALTQNMNVVQEASQAMVVSEVSVSNYKDSFLQTAPAIRTTWQEQFELNLQMEAADTASSSATVGFVEFAQAINAVDREVLANVEALKKQNAEMLAQKEYLLSAAMAWTSHYDSVDEQATAFEERREKLVATHQENLEKLNKRGQSRAVSLDVAAEKEKLALLQKRLEIALQSQTEFGDKTAESTRMRKDLAIQTLQGQVAEQTKLLDDYHAGRLIVQGESIGELLINEEARYEEELRLLNESRAEQELAQRESLGRMLLNNLESWATLNQVGGEEYQKLYLMTAEKYGLIDARGKQSAEATSKSWAAQLAIMRGEATGFFDFWKQKWDDMPTSKTIEIRAELYFPKTEKGRLGGETFQHGGISPGGMALVGEMGPELVSLPRGAHVFNNNTSNQFTMNVASAGTPGAAMRDFEMMRSLAG